MEIFNAFGFIFPQHFCDRKKNGWYIFPCDRIKETDTFMSIAIIFFSYFLKPCLAMYSRLAWAYCVSQVVFVILLLQPF